MAIYRYILTEATVYDSSGSKLREALNKFNSMNEEAYNLLQSMEAYLNKKDPNIVSKLDKVISYLKNIQTVYDQMDQFIDKYKEMEMKKTPEIADTIERDCENTKKTIKMMREKDAQMLELYSKQRDTLAKKATDSSVLSPIINRAKAIFTVHKQNSGKIQNLTKRVTA